MISHTLAKMVYDIDNYYLLVSVELPNDDSPRNNFASTSSPLNDVIITVTLSQQSSDKMTNVTSASFSGNLFCLSYFNARGEQTLFSLSYMKKLNILL